MTKPARLPPVQPMDELAAEALGLLHAALEQHKAVVQENIKAAEKVAESADRVAAVVNGIRKPSA